MSTKPTTTALAIHSQMPVSTMTDLVSAGTILAQSEMFGAINPAAGFVIVTTCHQQGISLIEFHRTYHIVKGKPSMRADAMLAEMRKRGARYVITENTCTRAAATFTFEGVTYEAEFTMEDAKRNGDCYESNGTTLKYNWQKRPDDMLWARMISRAVRRLCPEINAGLYTPEEVGDFTDNQGATRGVASPAPISPDEAVRRAKQVDAEEVVAEVVDDEPELDTTMPADIDYKVCPIGGEGVKGKPWSEFSDAELAKALKIEHEEITHTHRAAIRFEIEKRKNDGDE